jgi:intein/homing endonuclease
MAKNSSEEDSGSTDDSLIARSKLIPQNADRKLYFINEIVEWQLTQYIWTGCTKVHLRDDIMSHATELIRQIIRKQNLHAIYPGQDDSSFGDLLQTAWCVTPDTLVFSNGLSRIDELLGEKDEDNCDFEIVGRYGKDTAVYYTRRPATETFKIQIKQGYELEVTGDHPILTLTEDGPEWVKAHLLSPGDMVAVQAGQNCFGDKDMVDFRPTRKVTSDWWPEKISEELAYVLGLVISEGSIESQRVVIYNFDESVINYLANSPAGLVFRYEGEGRNVCDRVGFVDLLSQLGLCPGIRCYSKHIPNRLLKCSRNILISLLRGMFDGNGHSSRYSGEVGYSSSSIDLINQLRILLLNFNIVTKTSVAERGLVTGPKGAKHEAAVVFQLKMSSIESRRFYDTIGFNIPYKQDKHTKLTDEPFTLLDSVTTTKIQKLISNYTKSAIHKACNTHRHLIQKRKKFYLAFAQKLVAGLDIQDQFILDRLNDATAELRTIWLPIANITNGFSETIGIRVKTHQNFTANGVITHNCQIERTLYKYRSRPHCRNCFNPDRPADSLLYDPGIVEYGIKTLEEIVNMFPYCPRCKIKLEVDPIVQPVQGLYAGSETVLYRGMSKVFNMWCIAPESLLLSNNGFETIKNVINDDVPFVYGLYGYTKIVATLEKPMQDCIELSTTYGYNITCSPEHKLWAISNGEIAWKEVRDITCEDLVAIQYDQQVFLNENNIDITLERDGSWKPPSEMTESLSYLIGLFIANGSCSQYKLIIDDVDQNIADFVINRSQIKHIYYDYELRQLIINDARLVEFIIKLGFGDIVSEDSKFIPRAMFKYSKPLLASLIRGIFDSSKCFIKNNGSITFNTSSKTLFSQLRMLLLNFGILSKANEKQEKSYRLSIPNYYSLRFYEDIGFESSLKQNKQEHLSYCDSDMHDKELKMYGLNDKFRALHRRHGLKTLAFDVNKVIRVKKLLKAKHCTLGSAVSSLSCWNYYEGDPDYKFILDRINERQDIVNKLVWMPVKKKSSVKSRLCEISVDSKDHSYIANGFVSHNSQVARTVILAHIKKEGRDKKNSTPYITHLGHKHKPVSGIMERLITELRELNKYDDDNLLIIKSLEHIIEIDDKPHDGLIGKLVNHSGLSRQVVTNFMRLIKLRSFDISDSLVNKAIEMKYDTRKNNNDYEDDN